jgi:hypothetical protein
MRASFAGRRPRNSSIDKPALSHTHNTQTHTQQRDGPEVDSAKVQAAFSSLQAQAKASREAAKKR